jgi:hypothetical protein
VLDWFAYACIQVRFIHCSVACTFSVKVISYVCTFSHAYAHALAFAPAEMPDSLVPLEPGREGPFACAQPGRGGGPGNQTRGACIRRGWLSCMQPTKHALSNGHGGHWGMGSKRLRAYDCWQLVSSHAGNNDGGPWAPLMETGFAEIVFSSDNEGRVDTVPRSRKPFPSFLSLSSLSYYQIVYVATSLML